MRCLRLMALVVCLTSSAAVAADIDIAALPPGCLEPWQRVLTLASTLAAPVQAQGGTFTVVASGPDAVARAGFVVFPDVDAGVAPAALPGIPDDLVADGEVDIVETPFEVVVVLRPVEGQDLLATLVDGAAKSGGRFPDLVRRRVPLWRGRGVRALQLGDAGDTASSLPGETLREVAARFEIARSGTTGVVVAISRSLGGAARVQRALAAQPPQLLLHAGGTRGDACANALITLGVSALVPRTGDLVAASMSTPSSSFTALPFVAANLVDASGTSPWPRFRAFAVDGVRIAVIGLVGSGQLVRAPADVRARLRVTSGRDAVADVVAALRKASDGPPDLVIALSSGDGAERAQLSAVDGIDVVVGDFSRDDGLPVTQRVSPQLSREHARHDALVAPVFHRAGLGRVVAAFDVGAARPALTGVRVDVDPLLDDRLATIASSTLATPLRHDEDERAARGAPVLLPAVARLAAVPAAAPLVWGDRVALLGEVRRRAPLDPPLWTDDLWLRVIGNVVVDATGVDAALLRNVVHPSLVAGPMSRATVESWLDAAGEVVFVDIAGVELLRLVDRLAALPPSFDDASDKVAVSGLDVVRRVARARPIEPLASYRLAIDERLVGDPRFAGLFDRVLAGASHRLLVDVVVDHLSAVHADDARLVADLAGDRVGEWRVGVQGLELRGSAVRTSDNLAALAASGESRARQRDIVQMSARALLFATWDSQDFAFNNELRLQYDATAFTDGGPGPPIIEPFDDVTATTGVRIPLTRDPTQPVLSAFVDGVVDSELTPALPGAFRQAQLRESAGLALSTTGPCREVRLGGVTQQDASAALAIGADVAFDAGLLGALHLVVPLIDNLVLDETGDARFFFADADDRGSDLALRAQSVTRVATPLSSSLGGFVFLDVVWLSAKPTPGTIEWNVVVGAGLTFADVWRL